MSIGFIFWLILLLALIFGAYTNRAALGAPIVWGAPALTWVLLFLLGWRVFGWPITG